MAARQDNVNAKAKRAGRKRRMLGWTLFTLGVLVAGVWVWSGWWSVNFQFIDVGGWVDRGQIALVRSNEMWHPDSIEVWRRGHGQFRWRGEIIGAGSNAERSNWWVVDYAKEIDRVFLVGEDQIERRAWRGDDHLNVAFWPIPLLLWTPAGLLLRSGILARRRVNAGACPKCGYSLAGLAEGVACPECGKRAGTK